MWAALADKFGLTPDQIGDLTDWQLANIYYHPRDKDGILVPPANQQPTPAVPATAPTDADRLKTIEFLEAGHLITAENAARLRAELQGRAKNGNA